MSNMPLLYLRNDNTPFPRVSSDLDCEDAVSVSSIPAAKECLVQGGLEGIVLPWRTLIEIRKLPASEQIPFDALPLVVLLEDFPSESILSLSLRVIEQGGDDSLVGSCTDGATVAERLKVARLRRQFEHAPVCAGQVASSQWPVGFSSDVAPSGARPYAKGWSWHNRPLRVLLLLGDSYRAQQIAQWLKDRTATIVTRGRLEDAEDQLSAFQFDVAVVDWDLHDSQGAEVLQLVQHNAEELAFIVTSTTADLDNKEMVLAAGAQDWIVEPEKNCEGLWRTILCSAARQQRRLLTARMSSNESQLKSTSGDDSPEDRRRHPRYLLTKSIVVIPILSDQSPDHAFRGEGFTCNISESGLAFEVLGLDHLPGRYMLVGVEGDDGVVYYSTVEARNQQQQEGSCRIGACLVPPEKDLLQSRNLLPTLQPSTYQFATGLPAETLRKWVDVGVLQPFLIDRQVLCPKCHALSTLRRVCVHCGSVDISKCRLIRHFRCGYVGSAQDFRKGNEIVCPKCDARSLTVDTDFEYLEGAYRCLDCNWSETELAAVGLCLACHGRFALHQAWEEELIGYHVNRLDPLALIDPT
jgi:CheY-like chemotaxis protein